ncbi:MAG: DUF1573 domain-containing protein [Paludibacteraceae bacterium]|nr:DUF1573 domain-containing protein [Paludibacteraceae bacterium]
MKKQNNSIATNSRWNKVTSTLLTIISVLAALWIIFVLLYNNTINKGVRNVQQEDHETEIEYPLTSIEIPNKTQQLGEIERGDTISASFMIRNTGSEMLIIESVHPDCSCTNYELLQNQILSGEETKLTLTIETERKYGHQQINAVIDCNSEEGFHIIKVLFDVIDP